MSPLNLVPTQSKKMNVVDAVPPELTWPEYNNLILHILVIADADKSLNSSNLWPVADSHL